MKLFRVFLIVIFPVTLFAQKNLDSAIAFPMFSANFMVQVPGGDMAKRYGINTNIGGSFMFKTRNNIFFEVNANFIFGSNLKGDAAHLFDSIETPDGMIINENGEYAKVRTYERGYFIGAKMGGITLIKYPNPNSGILLLAGGGLLQHKIRIENDGNNAPQIIDDYKLGYDKMQYGFALTEFVGYIFFSKSQFFNCYAGFEFYQAWTKSGRNWDFNLMQKDNRKYFNLLSSFKVGWILPIYKREPQPYYFY
jgi:hypothetical protein